MNEDKVIQKLVEHDERLDRIEKNMVTKDDYKKHTELLESIVTIVKKTQEDHSFSIEWVKRLQSQVDHQEQGSRKHEDEIHKIKMQLKIA